MNRPDPISHGARDALVDEVLRQYAQREQMYREAGGDPNTRRFRQAALTAYIPHELICAARRERLQE
jgi:hypothetical protein